MGSSTEVSCTCAGVERDRNGVPQLPLLCCLIRILITKTAEKGTQQLWRAGGDGGSCSGRWLRNTRSCLCVQTEGHRNLWGGDTPEQAAVTGVTSHAEWIGLWGVVFDMPDFFLRNQIFVFNHSSVLKLQGSTGVHRASLSFQEYLFIFFSPLFLAGPC